MSLVGLILVDGKAFRFCGRIQPDAPAWLYSQDGEAARQVALAVEPLSSRYTFHAGGIELETTFTTPLLPDDLDLLSRPASYVDFEVGSVDGDSHTVKLYFDVSAEAAVNLPDQWVEWGGRTIGNDVDTAFVGTCEQNVLGRRGDDVRIDWGYLHLVAPEALDLSVAPAARRRTGFSRGEPAQAPERPLHGEPACERWPVIAAEWDLGTISDSPVNRFAVLGYDDIASIEYFGLSRGAYCFRNGASFDEVLHAAVAEHDELIRRCEVFGRSLSDSARRAGGDEYADLCSAAYRQAIAAHKLTADADGKAVFFSKECFSNGCIATVDVTYPSTPLFLLYEPELVKGMLRPIFRYASTAEWSVDYAPHDVGTYPRANGQVYGVKFGQIDHEQQMPVEECGNILILMAAIARIEDSVAFSEEHWEHLSRWAAYLETKGFDPENQLCTDDFAGHLAHNTNLSIKATVALAAYSDLCSRRGLKQEAARYLDVARSFARRWEQEARDDEHYRLTFDRPGTWSLKYNLIWDALLGYRLFSEEVYRREVAHYLKRKNRYGTPLDNRTSSTKSDWLVWAACLADAREDFEALIAPLWHFLDETPIRTPFCDWYGTTDALERSFHHRSVVGGVFMKLLKQRMQAF